MRAHFPACDYRPKWNKTLQRHFLWFAPSYVGLIVVFFFGGLFPTILKFAAVFVIGYALYRSAKSLVPLNRVSPTDILTNSPK